MPEKMTIGWARIPAVLRPLVAAIALALVSMLVIGPAPSYDPWAWLLWGREVAGGDLSTVDGPAFKPLPVAVCALLAPLGSAAPWLWVLLVRVATVLAAWLAFGLGRRLADGSAVAGALAAAGVLLCGALPAYSAAGAEPALVIALALGGAAAWHDRRYRLALACGIGCALLRVEAWPFLVATGIVLWRRRPQDRPLLAALVLLVPASWLVPELIGSGDLLRSGSRARIPNPGQPGLADVPGPAALEAAVRLPLWPLWLGVAALVVVWAARPGALARAVARSGVVGAERAARAAAASRAPAALVPAAAGAAWIALVALMAQAGFSGEPRYALPGAALIAISGAAGLVLGSQALPRPAVATRLAPRRRSTPRAPRRRSNLAARLTPLRRSSAAARAAPRAYARALAMLLVALAAAPRLADLADVRRDQAYQWRLAGDLADAVRAAGGRDAVLACGRPYVGPLRGPLMAYRMDVPKRAVEPDDPPRAPGVIFRSRLSATAPPAPAAPPRFSEVARAGAWQVLAACDSS
jgi:hypothetical protein